MASTAIPAKTKALVLDRDKGLCMLRISPDCLGDATVVDHRANRGSGGAGQRLNCASNLIAACGLCNGFKESGADRADLIARGLRVEAGRTHEHTAEKARYTPVLFPDGLFFLWDDGGKYSDPPILRSSGDGCY